MHVAFLELLESRRLFSSLAPGVVASEFLFDNGPQRIAIQFDTDVSASLSAADLQVQNHSTLRRISSSAISLSYTAANNTATFLFPSLPNGALADGNYRVRLLAAGVTDASGAALAADHVIDFFVKAADANHDRAVNISDFAAFAPNFNSSAGFSRGDFNYNGFVDLSDFALLAANFNQTLPALSPPTTRYTATILPNTQVQGVQFFVSATAMNDSAMVVGRVYGFPGGHLSTGSWAWQPGNANLAEAPGNGVTPTDIANNGTAVGSHYLMNRVAVRWGVGLPYHELGKLNSATITQYAAYGVNDLNQVVGQDDFPGAGFPTGPRGVNWLNGAGSVQSVGGRVISAINNNGDMIGDGPTFYPAGGSAITIGTGGGVATKMNEAGEVVGVMGTWTRNDSFFVTTGKPFYWNRSMSDPFMLELPGNQTSLHPRGINNAGQIVGSGQGLIWHEGMPYNINTLLAPGTNVPTISGIVDINNNGQMITSNQPPILLTPVTTAVEDKPSSNVPQRPVRAMSAKAERVATTASLSTARVIDDLEI